MYATTTTTAARRDLESGWCHSCSRVISLRGQDPAHLLCPNCSSPFVEAYPTQPAPPAPQPQPQPPDVLGGLMQHVRDVFNAVNARQQRGRQRHQHRGGIPNLVTINFAGGPVTASEIPFPAAIFDLFGTGIGIGSVGGTGTGRNDGGGMPGQFATMDDLLHHLFVTSQARGNPPASKRSIEGLERVTVSAEMAGGEKREDLTCSVCQEEMEVGEQAVRLPCRHHFHADCLTPWLNLHNTCPSCRFELPTDDPDYEARRASSSPSRR